MLLNTEFHFILTANLEYALLFQGSDEVTNLPKVYTGF